MSNLLLCISPVFKKTKPCDTLNVGNCAYCLDEKCFDSILLQKLKFLCVRLTNTRPFVSQYVLRKYVKAYFFP